MDAKRQPRKKAKASMGQKTPSEMNASDLLVKILENEGVQVIYGVPGEENLDFLEALRTSNIDLILTRHEQGAAFMAATYGRLTGKTGVCLATLGPGATNFVTAALSDGDYVHDAVGHADLIINVGHDVVEKPPFFMEPDGADVIHVNFKSAQVDNVYFPQLEVVGDIATSIHRLADRVGKTDSHDFTFFETVRAQVIQHIEEDSDDAGFPMKPRRLVADVRKAMPDDGIIALDNGVYKVWFARHYRTTRPNTVLLDNALATMGAGLPSAMEAARLYPDRKVMAICGDGGFMMNSQEMETALRLQLNLVVLVLNDSSYGMIRWKQYGMGFDDFGLEFGNPDFVAYAESYGAYGHRVADCASFVPLINQCYAQGGVHLVDLRVDYSDNTTVLIDELNERIG
jgi:acetolactate synthase-1/2/3 large subunit